MCLFFTFPRTKRITYEGLNFISSGEEGIVFCPYRPQLGIIIHIECQYKKLIYRWIFSYFFFNAGVSLKKKRLYRKIRRKNIIPFFSMYEDST